MVPSLNVARTVNCTSSPGLAVRLPGCDFQLGNSRLVLERPGIPARIQFRKHLIRPTADAEDFAAFMGREAARLAQQQAFLGNVGADAAGAELARQVLVVHFGGVAAERETEAVLTGPLAVADALIASVAGEDRDHVVDEGGAARRHGRRRRIASRPRRNEDFAGGRHDGPHPAGGRSASGAGSAKIAALIDYPAVLPEATTKIPSRRISTPARNASMAKTTLVRLLGVLCVFGVNLLARRRTRENFCEGFGRCATISFWLGLTPVKGGRMTSD